MLDRLALRLGVPANGMITLMVGVALMSVLLGSIALLLYVALTL